MDYSSAIATFNAYLRDRMDFLADISTATPLMEVTKYLAAEVISGFDRNRILLNLISGIDKFKFTLQVVDSRKRVEGVGGNSKDDILQISKNDIQVSIPNDILGCHALYVIIENVIRNTAKHGHHTSDEIVFFTLEVKDCEQNPELLEAWIHDNVERLRPATEDEKKVLEQSHPRFAERDEIKEIDFLVAAQNQRIDAPIIDTETNQLRHGAWGLIEMKASAGYLRRIPIEDIDSSKYLVERADKEESHSDQLPILRAVNVDGALGYVFHLRKPCEILIIDEIGDFYQGLKVSQGTDNSQPTKLKQLLDGGIRVITFDKFASEDVYSESVLVVLVKDTIRKELYQIGDGLYHGNLPTRIIAVFRDEIEEEVNNGIVYADGDFLARLRELPVQRIEYQAEGDLEKMNCSTFIWQTWLQGLCRSNKIGAFLPQLRHNQQISPIGEVLNKYDGRSIDEQNSLPRSVSIWIDHHGRLLEDYIDDQGFKLEFLVDHYEAYPSALRELVETRLMDETRQGPNELFDKNLLYRVGEGILQKILLIDERIQAEYKKLYATEGGKKIKKRVLFQAAGIFTLSDRIDLNAKHYGEDYTQVLEDEINEINRSGFFNGIDLVVIHLGVIERLLTCKGSPKNSEHVESFIRWLTQKTNARIVVTSGRGKPDNLPSYVPFLAYSSLSQYAIEKPFKALLVEAIRAARVFKF